MSSYFMHNAANNSVSQNRENMMTTCTHRQTYTDAIGAYRNIIMKYSVLYMWQTEATGG